MIENGGEVKIDAIRIGDRVRKDLGDIASLAESIKRHGLLHPIVIKTDSTLVAGHRRLEAVKSLGWDEIMVTVIDVADLLSAERDENTERKDFTPTEAVAIGRLIEDQHRDKIDAQYHVQRVASGKARIGDRSMLNQIQPLGAAAEIASKAVGLGTSKYRQAREVVTAAEADPEKFGDLPEKMDETGNVHGTHQEMKRRQGNGKARHPVHHKTHYPKPNREMERATHMLDGICTCLDAIQPEQLDAAKIAAWAESLKKSASTINRVARSLNGKD